jgi:hypothetical protein
MIANGDSVGHKALWASARVTEATKCQTKPHSDTKGRVSRKNGGEKKDFF